MTWLVEDRKGELHEILPDERVLVVGPNENYSRNWLLENHLPHFGNQFTVPVQTQWHNVVSGNWVIVVWLDGWEFNPDADDLKRVIGKLRHVQREIFA